MKPLASIFFPFLIIGCGGGDDSSLGPGPGPGPSTASYAISILAGSSTTQNDTSPNLGCQDGNALGADFSGVNPAFSGANQKFWLTQYGACDGKLRIREVDLSTNTIKTLAIASADPTGPSATFQIPASIAANENGDLYIADSSKMSMVGAPPSHQEAGRSSGIWRIPKGSSTPVKVAGVTLPSVYLPNQGVDGKGDDASFGYISSLCIGKDQLIYFNDNENLRTMTSDGVVKTWPRASDVKQMRVISCGSNGAVLVRRYRENLADDDYFDPVSSTVIGAAVSQEGVAYFSAERKTIGNADGSALAITGLDHGVKELVARYGPPVDHSANPPTTLPMQSIIAYDGLNFDMLTNAGILRFVRK